MLAAAMVKVAEQEIVECARGVKSEESGLMVGQGETAVAVEDRATSPANTLIRRPGQSSMVGGLEIRVECRGRDWTRSNSARMEQEGRSRGWRGLRTPTGIVSLCPLA